MTNLEKRELFIKFLKEHRVLTKFKKYLKEGKSSSTSESVFDLHIHGKDTPHTFIKYITFMIDKEKDNILISNAFWWSHYTAYFWSDLNIKWKEYLKNNK